MPIELWSHPVLFVTGLVAALLASLFAGSVTPLAGAQEDVDARRPDGTTTLQWAVFAAEVAEARRLDPAGADANATNIYVIIAMLLAADIAST